MSKTLLKMTNIDIVNKKDVYLAKSAGLANPSILVPMSAKALLTVY